MLPRLTIARVLKSAFAGIAILSGVTLRADENTAQSTATPASGKIYGIVVDRAGKPMVGAEVRLYEWKPQENGFAVVDRKAISDAVGKFEFPSLGDNNYVVAASSPGLATTRFSTILEDQSQQRFDIVLSAGTRPIVKLQTADGKPIAGATLQEFRCRNTSGELRTSAQNWKHLGLELDPSNAEGELRLPALPEGTVIVSATIGHPGFAPIKIKEVGTAKKVVATETMLPGVKLRLAIDMSLATEPLVEVKCSLLSPDRESPSEFYEMPMPVKNGAIELVVAPGKYESIELTHDKYFVSPNYRKPDIADLIEIPAGRESEFKFQLHKKIQVHGKVIDATSREPIKEAYVYAQVPNQPATDWTSVRGADTNERGEFTLEAPAGTARLSILCDNYTLGKAHLETRIVEDESQVLPDIELQRNPVVKGRVVDPDGKPIAGAILRFQGIMKFMRHAPVATDSQGFFALPVRRVPENFDDDNVDLAWTQPLEVFDPLRPLSTRIDTHLDKSELFSNMTIQLQQQSVEELLQSTRAPSTEWERKAEKVRAEDSAGRPNMIGATPPELDGQLWLNAEVPAPALAAFRGKYVLLDFWTVWCGPCHADFPEVKQIYETYKDHGLVVIGVHDNSVDVDSIREHVKQQGLKFPVVIDRREGGILAAYKKLELVNGYPSYVLIDPEGKIVGTNGSMSGCKFESIRKFLFGQKDTAK